MKSRKTKESSRKSRKTQGQIRHFLHFGLKDKLRCWVLSPLFIGIFLTVLISFGTIAYVEPIWFETTGNLLAWHFFKQNRKWNNFESKKYHEEYHRIDWRLHETIFSKSISIYFLNWWRLIFYLQIKVFNFLLFRL